jgi:ABC-type lipoprotein release transport system permease subunit
MIESGVSTVSGHVVLRYPRSQEEFDTERLLADASPLSDAVHRLDKGITVCPRLERQALLSSARGSAAVQLVGVIPEAEARVTRLHEQVVRGRYLSGDDDEILVGWDLAAVLDVQPGEKVVAMLQGEHEFVSQLLRVSGIFRTGAAEVDATFAQVALPSAQAMLGHPDAVSELTLHLRSPKEAAEIATSLRQEMDASAVEVLTWKEAVPELRSYIEADRAGNYIFLSIIGFIVAIGILNTMFMAIHERRHEIGLLLALGTPPWVLVWLTLLETWLLSLLSSATGITLGLLATWPVAHWGIDFSSIYGDSLALAGLQMDTRIFADFRMTQSLLFGLLSIAVSMAAGAWPALRAIHIEPIAAMHET